MGLLRAASLVSVAIGASWPTVASAYRHMSPAEPPVAADAPEVLTQAQMLEHFATFLKKAPVFRKVAMVSARPAVKGEPVASNRSVGEGDMVFSYKGHDDLLMATDAEDFASLFALEGEDDADERGFKTYRARGSVHAAFATRDVIGMALPGGSGAGASESDSIKFVAPSGEETSLEVGDMLLMPHPGQSEISRMPGDIFAKVYGFQPNPLTVGDGAAAEKKNAREVEEEIPEGGAEGHVAKKAKTE